jgi:hypothetical protein
MARYTYATVRQLVSRAIRNPEVQLSLEQSGDFPARTVGSDPSDVTYDADEINTWIDRANCRWPRYTDLTAAHVKAPGGLR